MKKKTPLLPSGFYDLLPPDASLESYAVSGLLRSFASFGYEQVSPPLMEFEASLLTGRWEELSKQTFRIMDPASHEMMGIRTDMTLQVGRIATSRLASAPRPVRLCYAGPILQSQPEPLRSERQLTQAGIELVGSAALQSDVEVIIVAAQSLSAIGIKDISIDINLPGLVSELCPEAQGNANLQNQIKAAVMHKNTEVISGLAIANRDILVELINVAGPADKALSALKKLKIPQASMINDVMARVKSACPKLKVTLDPIEFRGFDYHSGISFSIFAKGLRHELGRGGRYKVDAEDATGFTIYVTHLLKLLPGNAKSKTVMVEANESIDALLALHEQGWKTVYALTSSLSKEAKALGIGFQLVKGKIKKL